MGAEQIGEGAGSPGSEGILYLLDKSNACLNRSYRDAKSDVASQDLGVSSAA